MQWQRVHAGIPVQGAVLTAHADEQGRVLSFHLNTQPNDLPIVDRTPRAISRTELHTVLDATYRNYDILKAPQRYWVQHHGRWRHAWRTVINSAAPSKTLRVLIDAARGDILEEHSLTRSSMPLPPALKDCTPHNLPWNNFLQPNPHPSLMRGCIPAGDAQSFALLNTEHNIVTLPWDSEEISVTALSQYSLMPATYSTQDGLPHSDQTHSFYEDSTPLVQLGMNLEFQPLALHDNMRKVMQSMKIHLGQNSYDGVGGQVTLLPNQEGDGWFARTNSFGNIAFKKPTPENFGGAGQDIATIGHELMHSIEQTYYQGLDYGDYCDSRDANGMEEGLSDAFGAAMEKIHNPFFQNNSPWYVKSPDKFKTVQQHLEELAKLEAWYAKQGKTHKNCHAHQYGAHIRLIAARLLNGVLHYDSASQTSAFWIAPLAPMTVADLFLRVVKYDYPWHSSYEQFAEGLLQACLDAVGGPVGITDTLYTSSDCRMVERSLRASGLVPPNHQDEQLTLFTKYQHIDLTMHSLQASSEPMVLIDEATLQTTFDLTFKNYGPSFSWKVDIQPRIEKTTLDTSMQPFMHAELDAWVRAHKISNRWMKKQTLPFQPSLPSQYTRTFQQAVDLQLPIALWDRPVTYTIFAGLAATNGEIVPTNPIRQTAQHIEVGADYWPAHIHITPQTSPADTHAPRIGNSLQLGTQKQQTVTEYRVDLTVSNIGTRPVYGHLPFAVFASLEDVQTRLHTHRYNRFDLFDQMYEDLSSLSAVLDYDDFMARHELYWWLMDQLWPLLFKARLQDPLSAQQRQLAYALFLAMQDVIQAPPGEAHSPVIAVSPTQSPTWVDTQSVTIAPQSPVGTGIDVMTQLINFTPQPLPTSVVQPLPIHDTSLPIIDRGESFAATRHALHLKPGTTVYLFLDPHDQIAELDETNNVFAITVPLDESTTQQPLAPEVVPVSQQTLFEDGITIDVEGPTWVHPEDPMQLMIPQGGPQPAPLPGGQ